MPGESGPVVIRSTVDLTKRGGGCLEVGKSFDCLFDHLLEVRDVDSGDVLLVDTFDFEAKACGEVFLVADHDINILGDHAIHFLALWESADRLPKRGPVVEVVGNDGAVFLGDLAGLDSEFCVAFRKSGENPTGVKPADSESAEDVLEIEVIDGELTGGGVTTIRSAFCRTDSEATLGEVESITSSDTEAIEVSPLDELGIDSTLKNKVFEEASDFVINESGEDGSALTEAAAESTGDVVFATAFPGLKLPGGADAAIAGIETEHNFTHRDNVVGAAISGLDVEAHDFGFLNGMIESELENSVGAEDVRVSGEKIDCVVEAAVGLTLDGLVGAGANVAGDDTLGRSDKNVIGCRRFRVEDIGSVTANFA